MTEAIDISASQADRGDEDKDGKPTNWKLTGWLIVVTTAICSMYMYGFRYLQAWIFSLNVLPEGSMPLKTVRNYESDLFSFGLITFFPILLLILCLPVVSSVLAVKSFRTSALRVSLVLVVSIPIQFATLYFTIFGMGYDRWDVLEEATPIIINRGTPIIEAIEEYRKTNDEYPVELAQLVPKFLETLPAPGIVGCESFEYLRAEEKVLIIKRKSIDLDTFKEYELSAPVSLDSFDWVVVCYRPKQDYGEHFTLVGAWAIRSW